jgi:hypothetical protein
VSPAHAHHERGRALPTLSANVRGELELGWMLVRVAFAVTVAMFEESLRQSARR